ncbi:MAG TPA: YiaA/YiaB family inner membrane protein [Reyranella sp.]|jgi:hypothetical protein|nr:YiaA/YiaB family inner membrane protein [Reyranella sp.]
MHSDSPAWGLYCCASFAIAAIMMGIGISMMPGESWVRAYFAMSALLLTGSSFTLAKMLRDRHEAQRLHQRIEEAKTEQLLKTYELKPPLAA